MHHKESPDDLVCPYPLASRGQRRDLWSLAGLAAGTSRIWIDRRYGAWHVVGQRRTDMALDSSDI
jgi:hypothetical protein